MTATAKKETSQCKCSQPVFRLYAKPKSKGVWEAQIIKCTDVVRRNQRVRSLRVEKVSTKQPAQISMSLKLQNCHSTDQRRKDERTGGKNTERGHGEQGAGCTIRGCTRGRRRGGGRTRGRGCSAGRSGGRRAGDGGSGRSSRASLKTDTMVKRRHSSKRALDSRQPERQRTTRHFGRLRSWKTPEP